MACFLIVLVVCVVLNAGMDCSDGIYAHFKVVNNDFIDMCKRVNIRPINGSISDNIIDGEILKIEDPFYLDLDPIPIYPKAVFVSHTGIHIEGRSSQPKRPPWDPTNRYNNRYRYAVNCMLGGPNVACVTIDPYGNINLNNRQSNTYAHINSGQSYGNWTLYYSNEYSIMTYFKDGVYIKQDRPSFRDPYLNRIGGFYPATNSRSSYYTGKKLYDTIFIKNIIISIPEFFDSGMFKFQEYISGNDIQATERPTINGMDSTTNPSVKPSDNHAANDTKNIVTEAPKSGDVKSLYNMDNIYQNLFYGLLGSIGGICLTGLFCVCKQKKKKTKNG